MATTPVWTDLDGFKVSLLKNWRLNPMSAADRIALGATLNTTNIGLPVFDTTDSQLYFWDGTIWVNIANAYTLPKATPVLLGGIKVGDNLSVETDGTLNALIANFLEIAATYATVSNSTQKRLVYISNDETNNNDTSIYLHTGSELKFLQTVA